MTIEMTSMRQKLLRAYEMPSGGTLKLVALTEEEIERLIELLPEGLSTKQRGQAASRAVNRLRRAHVGLFPTNPKRYQNGPRSKADHSRLVAAEYSFLRRSFPEEYAKYYEEEKQRFIDGTDDA